MVNHDVVVDDVVDHDDVDSADLHLRRLCVHEVRWCAQPLEGENVKFQVCSTLGWRINKIKKPRVRELEILVKVVQPVQEVSQLSGGVFSYHISVISNNLKFYAHSRSLFAACQDVSLSQDISIFSTEIILRRTRS